MSLTQKYCARVIGPSQLRSLQAWHLLRLGIKRSVQRKRDLKDSQEGGERVWHTLVPGIE